MKVWKDINFLTNGYPGFQMSNCKEIRRLYKDSKGVIHYDYIPIYKKGKHLYYDMKFNYGDDVTLNVDKIFKQLFPKMPRYGIDHEKDLTMEVVTKIREDWIGGWSQEDLSRKYEIPIDVITKIVTYVIFNKEK